MLQEMEIAAEERGTVVVCVDDERPVLGALRRVLRGEPYELITTDDPERAMEWIERYDAGLVIADLRMPRMNGLDLLEAVRARSPLTVRILLTAYPDDPQLTPRSCDGMQWLLTKPWDEALLRATIRSFLPDRSAPPVVDEEHDIGGEG